jgi:glycosyltransferase involved in cell wall biosynthesis
MTPRPLRVLVVGPSLDILGGQSRQIVRLLDYFRNEPSITMEFLAVNPRMPRGFRWVRRVKYARTIFTALMYWFRLLLKAPGCDVLHIFSASYYSYLVCAAPAILIGRMFNKKTLLNYRSGEAEDHLTRWRWTAAPIIRLADVVVVPSNYLVDVFARFNLGARAIPNTVDQKQFVFKRRDPLSPAFLSNRLLEPLYNISCVLRAFALVQRSIPNASLIVAGDGSLRQQLEAEARDLKLHHLEFSGPVDFHQMPQLYSRADIYLNAPDLDNMPASILEAFACGLPVISTAVGGVPYIVTNRENGVLVPRNDHQAIAEAAIELLADRDLSRRLIMRALDSCRQYTWEVVGHAWLRLYRELAGDGLKAA